MAHCRFIQVPLSKKLLVFRKYVEISFKISSHEKITLLGDFNMTPEDKN